MADSPEIPTTDDIGDEPIIPAKSSGREGTGLPHQDTEKDVPISTTGMIQDLARRARPERSWEEIYEVRLRRFWAAAHRSAEVPDGVEEEWDVFKESMVRLGALGALVEDDTLPSEEIAGSLDDIQLIVNHRIEQGLVPNEVVNFIRTSLAPTIDRVEQRHEGTPERRTDIIIKALEPLQGTPEGANLGCELMRYMQTQSPEQRLVGYYDTIDDIGSLVRAGSEEYRLKGVLISHVVLDGMRTLVSDPRVEFNNFALGIVSNSAYRLATVLSGIFNERQEQPGIQASRVVRDLQAISAATTPVLPIDQAEGTRLARILGFQTRHPIDFLTVLEDMGSVGVAWQNSRIGQSRLVAMSGVTAALADKQVNAVSRMFNAGVSLALEDQTRSSPSEKTVRGRLLLNTVGLRLALFFAKNLFTALTQFSGLNCGVNLVGAFVPYQRMPDAIASVNQEFLPLIQDILNLTKSPTFQDFGARTGPSLARLAAASGALKLPPEAQPNFDLVPQHIEQALDSLRPTMDVSGSLDNLLLDSAQLITSLFDSILVAEESEDLGELVEGVVQNRENADTALIERYTAYASSAGDAVGPGPFVVAEVMTPEEWDGVATQLLKPRITIAPLLRQFEVQDLP